MVPPLVHPKFPVVPLGVFTVTFSAPGPEITELSSVTCNCVLLITVVASAVPLTIPREDETN